jgi:sugar phosphate isomerase/epimerase
MGIAAQLFTFRDHVKTPADFARTLERISKMGCTAAQVSAVPWLGVDEPLGAAKEARRILDDNGIKCIATHRPWSRLLESREAEIEFHQALGCDFAAIGGVVPDYGKSADEFDRFCDDAVVVAAELKDAGIRFGVHNHAYEFAHSQRGGTLYDIFIERGGDDLMLELDTYWAWVGGMNPATLLKRSRGRVPVIHLKDIEVTDDGPVMCPVGEGNLDWDEILAAASDAGAEWLAIEQDDCRRDVFSCFESSFNFLSSRV